MKIEFSRVLASSTQVDLVKKRPIYLGYTRLETQPTTVGMRKGLQAPLADPLWLLARQWQFNEFQGEDAGSPVKLAFSVDGSKIDRFHAGRDIRQPWQQLDRVPVETRVEAEPVWGRHARLAGEAGLQLLRMASSTSIRAALLAAYATTIASPADPGSDRAGLLWSTVMTGRTVDASRLRADLLPLLTDDGLSGLPAGLKVTATEKDAALALLERWLTWLDGAVYEGNPENPAWQSNRMEYAFALSDGEVELRADEYTDGHVDWEEFVGMPLSQEGHAATRCEFAVAQRHPSPVRYAGMPAERYWEFEDGQVNFARAEAGVTDLLRMAVTELALTFGNDWFIAPLRLPVGGLYHVTLFQITDTFGVLAESRPFAPLGGVPWTLFELTPDASLREQLGHTLFLPDSLDGVQEGAVLEHTLLARDEMANLAWAIEKTVQGVSGEPLDRDLEAKSLAFQQKIHFDASPDSPQLVYRLATPVPSNWTPLLPVRNPALDIADPLEIRLARAGMKRFYPGHTVAAPDIDDAAYTAFLDILDAQPEFIESLNIDPTLRAYVFWPRGWLLRRNPTEPMAADDQLIIEEEEVLSIGASLKRKFQYARSSDGRIWMWIGRSKLAGRGEAESQLQFDCAAKTTTLR
ncbi:hypothetical protein ACQKRQ_38405 [Paraburkholderia sp. NPDC080076]|uniref:hypothetical protein n=1 Tax=Paraburkholderia sp. NPDC080076 TaxID=3390605 RepID=UPI003D00D479